MVNVDGEYLARTLAELVRINSINPAFSAGATNEAEIARWLAAELERLGLAVALHEPEPGRASVVGTLKGGAGGRSILLYGHIDTVGVEGMDDPFAGTVRDDRLYGRGAYDMKCGVAACLAAVKALAEVDARPAGDVLVAFVADEEVASVGMAEVLRHHRADAAIVTEPTELELVVAHKGFCWIEVETIGRAAHGSRFDLGIDANLRMGRFLAELERLEAELRRSPPHALLGPPSLHAALLQGGTGESTYAARCRLVIERRTLPGETPGHALGQVRAILERLAAQDPSFQATARVLLARDAWETSVDAPAARIVARAAGAVLGHPPTVAGRAYWMDTALIAAAGADVVVIGPTGAGAHADEEWVELESVRQVAEVLARAAAEYTAAAEVAAPVGG